MHTGSGNHWEATGSQQRIGAIRSKKNGIASLYGKVVTGALSSMSDSVT